MIGEFNDDRKFFENTFKVSVKRIENTVKIFEKHLPAYAIFDEKAKEDISPANVEEYQKERFQIQN